MNLECSNLDKVFHDFLTLKKIRRTGWQLRGIRNGVHQVSGMVGNRVGQVGQQSAHGASMPVQAGELRTGAADWPVASLGTVGVVYAA